MHVFTYGTLMFPEVWRTVVSREFATVQGTASGYATYRVRNAHFPGMTAAGNDELVRGVVYLDVDDAALNRLDCFEDTFYERQEIPIDCDDGKQRTAAAYIISIEKREILTDERWHADDFIARGHLAGFIERFAGFSRLSNSD